MKHLHRDCYREVTDVNLINGDAYCPYCQQEIALSETIRDFIFEARVKQLKAMHELMLYANDEHIYDAWVHLMPDEPSDEDIDYIAMDDEAYNECFDLFVELIEYEGNRH